MPIYEHFCDDESCPDCDIIFEGYFTSFTSPAPECKKCGFPTKRALSVSHALWARPLSHYNDGRLENASKDGFWAMRKDESGQNKRHYIDSMQKIKEHAKATGAICPTDLPNNIVGVNSNGTQFETTNVSEV